MARRKIEVVPYNPNWPKAFEQEKVNIIAAVGEPILKVEHIGSTSVPGLSAKPIIDILIEVSDLERLRLKKQNFQALGYLCKGENGIPGRLYFQKGGNARSHHVHVFQTGNTHLLQHLAFKAYLISYSNIAEEYSKVKQLAAQQAQNDSQRYMALKEEFITTHLPLALEHWHR